MRKLLLILTLPLLLSVGCSKKEACERDNVVTVYFHNSSSNPYYCKQNGITILTAPGKSTVSKELQAGGLALSYEQVSGYVLYPTTGSRTFNGEPCGTIDFYFP